MTEKRFNLVKCKEHRWGIEDNTLEKEDKLFFICREGQFETNGLVLLLNQLNDENEELKKGMIGVVDRYIKNVECNPPSSLRTYGKIKGALVNIREDLRSLIGDFE